MNKTQAGRLLTLAHFLKTEVEPLEFDMGHYTEGELPHGKHKGSQLDCGSSACALGWATVVFPETFWFESSLHWGTLLNVDYCDHTTRSFFGLVEDEPYYLFGENHRRTPEQEAKVIEDFVDAKGYVYADEEGA